MQTFAIGMPRGWLACVAAGRNPLVRGSDRLEALVILLMIIAVIMAVPVAGAIGTAVHDTRSQMYAEQAKTRHAVAATAIQDGTALVGPNSDQMNNVRARWWAAGAEHTKTIAVQGAIKAGEEITIWVDTAGDYTSAPASANHAAADAIGIAVMFGLSVAAAAATAIAVLRQWMKRIRFAQWENEFRELVDNDGRKRSQ